MVSGECIDDECECECARVMSEWVDESMSIW